MTSAVVHAVWSQGGLHLWAERVGNLESTTNGASADGTALPAAAGSAPTHPGAISSSELREVLALLGVSVDGLESAEVRLAIPSATPQGTLALSAATPLPSPRAAHAAGMGMSDDAIGATIAVFATPGLRVSPALTGRVLEALDAALIDPESETESRAIWPGASLEFFALLWSFIRWLLAQQRFVPAISQELSGALRGMWQPWLADEISSSRLKMLLAVMPPAARSPVDTLDHEAWPIVEDFLVRVGDAACRETLVRETMIDTIDGRDETTDAHVSWLTGLLAEDGALRCPPDKRSDLFKRARGWVGALEERGPSSAWRLALRLNEPLDLTGLTELQAPGPSLVWRLSIHLQSVEDPSTILDAQEIWLLPADSAMIGDQRVDKPQELLLAELSRAARLFKPLEQALSESEPTHLNLNTSQAYEFLREVRPILIEQGYSVPAPAWWDSPASRLGVRLRIDAGEDEPTGTSPGSAAASRIGLATLVNYTWQVSLGDATLTLSEFEKLAAVRSPLVMIGGRWVEIRPEDLQNAVSFIRENPGGEMELGKAIRLAYAADMRTTGLPVVGMEVAGWAANIFGANPSSIAVPILTPPDEFVGSLRPYQLKGLSWLAFLDRFGLGACLADDMGLGKTIQLLAMLLYERNAALGAAAVAQPAGPVASTPAATTSAAATAATATTAASPAEPLGPTLLIVPMSVVGNWMREARRFAPSLRVMTHHGLDRARGEALFARAIQHDLVITTYALAYRDREHLEPIPWRRIALDEAQNIKNPQAKQTQAIRALDAPRRIALTGTPIENRLSELWSIIDFLNPGLLGTLHDFRTNFALPIERYRDASKAKRLRSLVQPFVLRRLKTDPTVIADLPEKVQTKDYCYLTPEQASLYEATVKSMLSTAENSEGIQRRGVILAGLVKLKQICNHPQLYLKAADDDANVPDAPISPARSGKCVRLIEMLDEVVNSGGQALVFSQFRQMGILLAKMLRHELDRDVLLLHGGTTAAQRDAIVASFQRADGKNPILVLSLKAGGVGLNLTAANHVFHFDRWWNPAVESQATDRAYRIGQTRTVQVHKFIVAGTLEERIDQMIEQKTDLADNVIGSGEAWLTELSLAQLRDVLMLRPEAVELDDADSDAAQSAFSATSLAGERGLSEDDEVLP